jgi:hypothetical protein
MASQSTSDEPGGFFQSPGLPSPAPSSVTGISSSQLPHPRQKSLLPGSKKEDTVRRYVDERLMIISRRYVKKFGIPDAGDEITGYQDFSELCKDMDGIIDVLWLSGTRMSPDLPKWCD